MSDQHVPVLIVGGSLVGLTTSLLLSSYGVPNLLVERHRGTAIHPRAASFHQRTMETFRSLGMQEAVEEAAAKEFVQNGAIVAVESLGGKELHHFFQNFNAGVEDLSPTLRLFITQIGLEPLVRDRAQALGAEHRFGTELVSFEQDADGVTSVIRGRDGGAEQTIRSDYLIGADGAHSAIRDQLGIPMLGRGDFADCVTIYFKADVRHLIGERNLSVIYVNHPEMLAFFRFSITGQAGFLAIFSTIDADGRRDTQVGETMDEARCIELVRKALGSAPDLPVEIDSVQRWSASAATAERFSDGRVFLVGDSAHVMPPTGGFGGNTGIADAYNLAWKLAKVHAGAAGPGLLETYSPERRPGAHLTVEQAYTRYVLRVDPSLPQDNLAPTLDDPSIELGIVHASAAVLPDGTGPSAEDEPLDNPRTPSGRVGARVAHLVLERGGEPVSTHDLVGREFVLFAGADGQGWCQAAKEVGAALDVPLEAYRVGAGADLVDPSGTFAAAFGVGAGGAALIRPDGVLAWRAPAGSGADAATLTDVMKRVLARA